MKTLITLTQEDFEKVISNAMIFGNNFKNTNAARKALIYEAIDFTKRTIQDTVQYPSILKEK